MDWTYRDRPMYCGRMDRVAESFVWVIRHLTLQQLMRLVNGLFDSSGDVCRLVLGVSGYHRGERLGLMRKDVDQVMDGEISN